MTQREAEAVLADLSAGQWGLFTTKQAADRGISGTALGRSEIAGRIERLAHGAYRQASVPPSPLDDLRAAWLLTKPSAIAEDRLSDHDVVVGHATAAFLHGAGDLLPEPYVFLSAARRQTRRHDVSFRHRRVDAQDVRLIDGLPTTSIERTIADLLADRQDDSLVADVLRDAARTATGINEDRLVELIDEQNTGRHGPGGRAIYEDLAVLAGVDEISAVVKSLTSPTAALLLSNAFALQMDQIMNPIREALTSATGRAALDAIATISKVVDSYPVPKLGPFVTPGMLRGLENITAPTMSAASMAALSNINMPVVTVPTATMAAVRAIQDNIRLAAEINRSSAAALAGRDYVSRGIEKSDMISNMAAGIAAVANATHAAAASAKTAGGDVEAN